MVLNTSFIVGKSPELWKAVEQLVVASGGRWNSGATAIPPEHMDVGAVINVCSDGCMSYTTERDARASKAKPTLVDLTVLAWKIGHYTAILQPGHLKVGCQKIPHEELFALEAAL